MPRKIFRRFLPSHETIRNNRHVSRLGKWIQHHNLWHLHRRSVAGGVAVGLFSGLIPGSNPVQFMAAAIGSALFRVNLPVAVFVTLYSNPFTIVPLYYVAYRIGFFLTGEMASGPQTDIVFRHLPMDQWIPTFLHWLGMVGKPLALGLLVEAAVLAVAGYFLTRWAWRGWVVWEWSRRRKRRAPRAP